MTLYTRITIEECKTRLAPALKPAQALPLTWTGDAWSDPIVGTIDGDSFQIQVQQQRRYSCDEGDTCPRFFSGRLLRSPQGSVIRGEFRVPRLKIAFYLMGVLVVVSVLGIIGGVRDLAGVIPLLCLAAPLAAAVVLFALMSGRASRKQRRGIVRFLKKTLDANETT